MIISDREKIDDNVLVCVQVTDYVWAIVQTQWAYVKCARAPPPYYFWVLIRVYYFYGNTQLTLTSIIFVKIGVGELMVTNFNVGKYGSNDSLGSLYTKNKLWMWCSDVDIHLLLFVLIGVHPSVVFKWWRVSDIDEFDGIITMVLVEGVSDIDLNSGSGIVRPHFVM